MEFVLMMILGIVIAVAIIIYPRKDTFIEKLKLKGNYKSFELEIRAKQKNCPPKQSDSSKLK
jgi:hypothetical protein